MFRSVPFFVVLLACALSAKADFIINGNSNSGWVRAGAGFEPTRLIVGKSTGDHNYNGIAAFTLPTLAAGEQITGASLSFVTSNGGTVTGANIDIWSLGAVTDINLQTQFSSLFLQSDTDGTAGRVKIANDFITSGTAVNGTKQTNAAANTALAAAVQTIYDNDPSAAGKLLLIRVNPDQTVTNVSGSFRFYGGNEGASNAPKLTLVTEIIAIPTPASIILLAPAALAWVRRGR